MDYSKKPEAETVTTSGESGSQKFPLRPKTWDYVKEAFQPTDVRAQIDAIRKRKTGNT